MSAALVQLAPSRLRLAVAAAILVSAVAAVGIAQAHFAPDAVVLPGLRLGGETAPACRGEADVRAWVAMKARAREERRVTLVSAGEPPRVLAEGTLAELGARVDVEATVARVLSAGRARDLLERVARVQSGRRGEVDVPFAMAVDAGSVRARIERLKATEDAPPVSARLDLDHHAVLPEVPGHYLDADGAVGAVERAAAADAPLEGSRAVVPVAHIAPRFTRSRIEGLDVHAVLAAYDTYFSRSKDQARRGKNIDVAAAKLDGLVLMPGELFSFNDAVGDRSEENGFERSWEIHKGEMVEGVGGGTCQVASTLYAAAFFSGLEVLERLPHSRPSAYVPMGLDATVVYPDVDMKLRNPFDFPIALHAKVDGNRLHIELLGATRPARSVQFTREITESVPYDRKVEEDARLGGATVRVKQHGIAGYTVKRTRLISLAGGKVKREETTDTYPPTMEIDEVPVGFDEARLPPLPGEAPTGGGEAATATASVGAPELVFLEAPGAHAPTKGQASPPKLVTLTR